MIFYLKKVDPACNGTSEPGKVSITPPKEEAPRRVKSSRFDLTFNARLRDTVQKHSVMPSEPRQLMNEIMETRPKGINIHPFDVPNQMDWLQHQIQQTKRVDEVESSSFFFKLSKGHQRLESSPDLIGAPQSMLIETVKAEPASMKPVERATWKKPTAVDEVDELVSEEEVTIEKLIALITEMQKRRYVYNPFRLLFDQALDHTLKAMSEKLMTKINVILDQFYHINEHFALLRGIYFVQNPVELDLFLSQVYLKSNKISSANESIMLNSLLQDAVSRLEKAKHIKLMGNFNADVRVPGKPGIKLFLIANINIRFQVFTSILAASSILGSESIEHHL
jgi:hypothetical protein